MQVMAATMRVTHTFEVVLQEELAAVVCMGDVYPVHRRCVDGRNNPKPWPYLHLWTCAWGVGVLTAACNFYTSRRVAEGGGRGRSGGATPPGRLTSSGQTFRAS